MDGLLVIAGKVVHFGRGWCLADRSLLDEDVTASQRRVVDGEGGVLWFVNERSGFAGFTVRRVGFTDVYSLSPDGRTLRYLISVTDDGVKTTEPTVAGG